MALRKSNPPHHMGRGYGNVHVDAKGAPCIPEGRFHSHLCDGNTAQSSRSNEPGAKSIENVQDCMITQRKVEKRCLNYLK